MFTIQVTGDYLSNNQLLASGHTGHAYDFTFSSWYINGFFKNCVYFVCTLCPKETGVFQLVKIVPQFFQDEGFDSNLIINRI